MLVIGGRAITPMEIGIVLAGAILLMLLVLAIQMARAARHRAEEAAAAAERQREIDDKIAQIMTAQAAMGGGVQSGLQGLSSRQSDLARFVSERIEGLQHRVGQGLADSVQKTSDNLAQLNERLAVIDAAQKNLTDLTGEVVGLKDILANKQARGAYGQGRMEAIVRDGLPGGFYEFQATLSNRTRPDCLVKLPGDGRGLVIDAKFPLEGFTAFREAKGDDARRQAAARVRTDILTHVKDIAEKYLVPGETQDMALLFVPSEAIYADLHEHFDDLMQKAHRARVVVVSPSLLALAIQVMQSLVRDARVREEARLIQAEVGKLLDDVRRLRDRAEKLDTHFRQAGEDVTNIRTSADKIAKRGEKIEALDFDEAPRAEEALPRLGPGRPMRAAE